MTIFGVMGRATGVSTGPNLRMPYTTRFRNLDFAAMTRKNRCLLGFLMSILATDSIEFHTMLNAYCPCTYFHMLIISSRMRPSHQGDFKYHYKSIV